MMGNATLRAFKFLSLMGISIGLMEYSCSRTEEVPCKRPFIMHPIMHFDLEANFIFSLDGWYLR